MKCDCASLTFRDFMCHFLGVQSEMHLEYLLVNYKNEQRLTRQQESIIVRNFSVYFRDKGGHYSLDYRATAKRVRRQVFTYGKQIEHIKSTGEYSCVSREEIEQYLFQN